MRGARLDADDEELDAKVVVGLFVRVVGEGVGRLDQVREPLLGQPEESEPLEPEGLGALAWVEACPGAGQLDDLRFDDQ